MELNPWVAVVNSYGRMEVREVSLADPVHMSLSPLILRLSREGEIIVEVQRKPIARRIDDEDRFDDRKNLVFRCPIGNGPVSVYDANEHLILQCIPCRSHAKATRAAKELIAATQERKAA